jgi:hypothetical protein
MGNSHPRWHSSLQLEVGTVALVGPSDSAQEVGVTGFSLSLS